MEMLKVPRKPDGPPPDLSAAVQAGNAPTMEVAHVLFMDVVGFSQLRMNQQAMVQVELQNLVQATPEVQQARKEGKLIVRPTGDGMALLFLRDLLSPVRCALQLQALMQRRDAEIRQRIGSPIRLRMGVHSGSVLLVEDMNAQSDVAGDGIIMAQRVMDCGDAGHILLSDEVARKILGTDPWPRYLTDLGEVHVKHGVKVHLYNLYGRLDGPYCGNPSTPKKVEEDRDSRAAAEKKFRGTFFDRNPGARKGLSTILTLAILGGGGYALWTKVPAVPAAAKSAWANMTKPKSSPSPKPTAGGKKPTTGGSGKSSGTGKSGGGAGSSAGVYAGSTERRKVMVPDLIGRTVDEAKVNLRAEGLSLKISKRVFNATYGEGIIVKQSVAAGGMVNEKGTVFVQVSKGEPHVDVKEPEEPTEPEVTEPAGGDESTGGEAITDPGEDGAPAVSEERPRRGRGARLLNRIRQNRGGGEQGGGTGDSIESSEG
jgi:class 3 adenylate cyclase